MGWQQERLRRQSGWGKVINSEADWEREQMGMRELAEVVKQLEKCGRSSRRS